MPTFNPLNSHKSLISDEVASNEWQSKVSEWLISSGCLYMLAWGEACSSWDDSVDFANMKKFDFNEIPDEQFVMTTWHENELLNEIFWSAKNNSNHGAVNINNTLLLHISSHNRETEYLAQYSST